MTIDIKELNENLQAQLSLYQEFNRLALLKKEALIHNKLQELDAVTLQEEQLLLQLGRIEEKRLDWIAQADQATVKNPEELTLAELTKTYPELSDVYTKLENTTAQLREIHNINSQLIDQALKTVNFTVNLLTPSETNIYKNPDQKETSTTKIHLIDQKI